MGNRHSESEKQLAHTHRVIHMHERLSDITPLVMLHPNIKTALRIANDRIASLGSVVGMEYFCKDTLYPLGRAIETHVSANAKCEISQMLLIHAIPVRDLSKIIEGYLSPPGYKIRVAYHRDRQTNRLLSARLMCDEAPTDLYSAHAGIAVRLDEVTRTVPINPCVHR